MRNDQSFIESVTQSIQLENCRDAEIAPEQLKALQEKDINACRGIVRIAGATVRYNYLEPPRPIDEVPVVVINGYCGTEGAYKRLAVELAIQGRPVALMRPPRTQTPFMAMRYDHIKDVLKLQSQSAWAVMRDLRYERNIDKYDLYGHSMGAAIAAKTADEKSQHVRSIVYAGGAGLNGKNTFFGMLGKSIGVIHHDVLEGRAGIRRHAPGGLVTDTLVHVFRRPDRTVREGFTVARINIQPHTERIRQAGVKVGAILFERDGYFLTEEVLENSGHLFDAIFETPNASHVYPQDHPMDHADDVARLLQRLNNNPLPLHTSPKTAA